MFFVLALLVPVAFTQNPPPGNTPDCFDAVGTCVQLKNLGYCVTNTLVREKCPVSCDNCPTPNPTPAPVSQGPAPVTPVGPAPKGCDPAKPDCCDLVQTCVNFQRAGSCESRPQQVGQICPFTCGMCGSGERQCSKSALDCYSQQMSCAQELRTQGVSITAEALINCVLPKAQQLAADSCCSLFATYQYHCHDKTPSVSCECANYDAYYAWVDLGKPTDPTGRTTCMGVSPATFQVRENYFANAKACEKSLGEKLTNSYTYSWTMDACNDVLPNGSVQVTCGSGPGSLQVTEFSRSGCRGKQGKTKELIPGQCVKHKKESVKYNFHTESCGAFPSPMPTASPVAYTRFQTFQEWKDVCKTKTSKKSCKSCGGKWNKQKCKLTLKQSRKVKCKKLDGEVCAAVGCNANTAGKKIRCSGTPNFAW